MVINLAHLKRSHDTCGIILSLKQLQHNATGGIFRSVDIYVYLFIMRGSEHYLPQIVILI